MVFRLILILVLALALTPAMAQQEEPAPAPVMPDQPPAPPAADAAPAPTPSATPELPAAPQAEDAGWAVTWREALGRVRTFSEAELPAKMKAATDKGRRDNAETQFILGYMYQFGEGVAPDDVMAQKWYSKAAKAKYSSAMVGLGELYATNGDPDLSAKWYSRAADAGEHYASYKLGEIYEYGYGTIQPNPEKAFKNYAAAAEGEGRIENAFLKLGQFYQYGFGVPVDVNKAVEYYRKLLDTDNATRKQQVNYMLSEVYAQIAEQHAGRERADWLTKSAEQGNLRSIVRLADIYNAGDGDVVQSIPEAIKWYDKAVALGDVYSMIKLGYIYNNGTVDMDPDYCKAYDYFFKAAEKKSKEAMYNLGNFYYSGYCKPQDYEQANEWWRRSQQ